MKDYKYSHRTEGFIQDLLAALEKLEALEIDERLRSTLIRACSESLVEAEDRLQDRYERRNAGEKWAADDLKIFEDALANISPPTSWGEEKLILDMLVQRLGRGEKVVKKKAIELGYGKKVDYLDLPK